MVVKLVDTFIFYNELNLLNYRINVLYDIVDFFVLVESTHTHTGNEKKLFYEENKKNFKKFEDKIIHIVVDDFPYKQPNIDIKKNQQWVNENYQRKQIERGIDKIDINPQDIIIVSDVDEIPNPDILYKIKNNDLKVNILRLEMDFYYYNLKSLFQEKWDKAIMFSFSKKKLYNFDYNFPRNNIKTESVKNGGWHLSFFGDSNFIHNKIKEFAHQEYNNDDYNKIDKIEDKVKTNKDLFGRSGSKLEKIEIHENSNLPIKYEEFLKDFI